MTHDTGRKVNVTIIFRIAQGVRWGYLTLSAAAGAVGAAGAVFSDTGHSLRPLAG